jgi:pimeloyl-ACP methyl ester carboxylesterase
MAGLIEGAGVPLMVREQGSGPPVLLVHDRASDAEHVLGRAGELDGVARVLAHDRRGYGASGSPVPYEATTVHEQAEDAACVLRSVAGQPAVVAGEGFGALVALDLLTRHRTLLAGAALLDPPLFAFVPEAGEALAAERLALEDALREGGPERAVRDWLGDGADPQRAARAAAAHGAFFADTAGLASWPVTRGALRASDAPVVVVTTPAAARHVLAASDALAALVPGARRVAGGDLAAAVRSLLPA